MKRKIPTKIIRKFLSQETLNLLAREYGCTQKHLIRVLRKEKTSHKLNIWLALWSPHIATFLEIIYHTLNAKPQKRRG